MPKAVLSPAAAYVISAKWGAELRALARERSAHRGQEWLGLELLRAAEELQQVGRAWVEAGTVDPDAPAVSAGAGRELSSSEAAKVLHLGVRQVTKLAGKAIAGRQVGRRWLLEEWSVLAYRDRASSEREGDRNSA